MLTYGIQVFGSCRGSSALYMYLLCQGLIEQPPYTVGEPDAPQDVKVIEIRDNMNVEGSCVFTLQLSPPSNIGADDIMYYINYQSQRDVISRTSHTFIALNCTPNLRINVTAVNRCGSIGKSVIDVVPIFLPDTRGIEAPSATDGVNIGKY